MKKDAYHCHYYKYYLLMLLYYMRYYLDNLLYLIATERYESC